MIAFAADQNFDMLIAHAVWRNNPNVIILHISEAGHSRASDDEVLAWAAANDMVLLTHDVRTMERFAFERVARGQPMSGVVIIPRNAPMRQIVQDISILAECSNAGEWNGRVIHLPL